MIFLLPFVFLGGWLNQAGSIVLTSSPLTAIDGELFTLMCVSNTTGGPARQWFRDGTSPVLTTKQGPSSLIVVDPNAFNKHLSGRVNVSCDATQHNVTLRINSTIDNGSVWQCVDNQVTQRSNTMTINVYVSKTSPFSTSTTTSSTASTSTFTTTTTTTSTSSSTTTTTNNNNNNNNTHGRPISTSGFTTATTTYRSTGQSDTIAIAAAAGGGVAVIPVVIVATVCIRKRRRSVDDTVRDKSRRDRNPSRSVEMLIESGLNGEDENVMMDNIIYTSSFEVVPAEYSIRDHNQADKDVYTEVKKVKTNADQHEVTDMYAKPLKGRKETPIGDMYAQVKKVKSREGTSENIEDMYAKPQKDKRNVKSNADTD